VTVLIVAFLLDATLHGAVTALLLSASPRDAPSELNQTTTSTATRTINASAWGTAMWRSADAASAPSNTNMTATVTTNDGNQSALLIVADVALAVVAVILCGGTVVFAARKIHSATVPAPLPPSQARKDVDEDFDAAMLPDVAEISSCACVRFDPAQRVAPQFPARTIWPLRSRAALEWWLYGRGAWTPCDLLDAVDDSVDTSTMDGDASPQQSVKGRTPAVTKDTVAAAPVIPPKVACVAQLFFSLRDLRVEANGGASGGATAAPSALHYGQLPSERKPAAQGTAVRWFDSITQTRYFFFVSLTFSAATSVLRSITTLPCAARLYPLALWQLLYLTLLVVRRPYIVPFKNIIAIASAFITTTGLFVLAVRRGADDGDASGDGGVGPAVAAWLGIISSLLAVLNGVNAVAALIINAYAKRLGLTSGDAGAGANGNPTGESLLELGLLAFSAAVQPVVGAAEAALADRGDPHRTQTFQPLKLHRRRFGGQGLYDDGDSADGGGEDRRRMGIGNFHATDDWRRAARESHNNSLMEKKTQLANRLPTAADVDQWLHQTTRRVLRNHHRYRVEALDRADEENTAPQRSGSSLALSLASAESIEMQPQPARVVQSSLGESYALSGGSESFVSDDPLLPFALKPRLASPSVPPSDAGRALADVAAALSQMGQGGLDLHEHGGPPMSPPPGSSCVGGDGVIDIVDDPLL
jgi:hypothetical protein